MLSEKQVKILETQRNIELLKKREERYAYFGLLQEYQLHSKEELQKLDYKKLNPYQHFLFKRVLHGLNVYTAEEVNALHWDKKRRIKKVWLRGQEVINKWKQTICNRQINNLLFKYFGDNVKAIVEIPAEETLPDYKNTLTLKELGLNYEDLMLKFMSEGLLPKNFLSLKSNAY